MRETSSGQTEFILERWLDDEREGFGPHNHKIKGYIPFGALAFTVCVRKLLALLEIRLFITPFMRKLGMTPSLNFDLEQYPFVIKSGFNPYEETSVGTNQETEGMRKLMEHQRADIGG
jgi:hypothetical protein